jgi:hypothetical protein
MDTGERSELLDILRDLFMDAQIVGVHWIPAAFTILVTRFEPVRDTIPLDRRYGFLELTIETRWSVFPARQERYPESEDELPDPPLGERVSMLACLDGQKIVDVELGQRYPHLILTFDTGAVLFLNGYHPKFECWHLNTRSTTGKRGWLIVAQWNGRTEIYDPPKEAARS